VATVRYSDKNLPLEVTAELFSPFIPGNAKDSGMPATIQAITMKKYFFQGPVSPVVGWLENKNIIGDGKE